MQASYARELRQAQGDAYGGTIRCTQTMCRRYSLCHASAPDVRRGDGVGSWSKCALIERCLALATPDSPSFPPPRWLARITPRARTSTLVGFLIAHPSQPASKHGPSCSEPLSPVAVEATALLLLLLLRRLFGLTSTTSMQIRRKLVIVGQCGPNGRKR